MDGVDKIIQKVEERGDAALIELTQKYDGVELANIEVSADEIRRAFKNADENLVSNLKAAAKNIKSYAEKSMPKLSSEYSNPGVRITDRLIPVESAGVYVPGGEYPYPSTVLMTAIPARVAGVEDIYMVSPPGNLSDAVLAAASIAGVDRIFRVGGAQAVAALAYGTETVPKADMVVGPGNSYVQAAKRKLSNSGHIGIDMLAGPSEVVIIGDSSASGDITAIDLMAQAEHAEDASATLLTDSKELLEKTKKNIDEKYKSRIELIYTESLSDAVKISNNLAPEHLQVICSSENSDRILEGIKNAGAVFVGAYTPVAVGDYWAGPSHTLPTGMTAKFSEGLNVRTFLKKISFMFCSKNGLDEISKSIESLANEEGMKYHARSVSERKKEK
ncbi:MAG: histidinol dehydrogenase [Elusimicrobiota bacterium]|nr:histidinol dehydrogenase [Elusimicrobiota bacterium]